MTDLQKKDLVIESLRVQNTALKMELANTKREVPTPDIIRKAYFFELMLEAAKSYPQKQKINFKKVD